VVEIKLVHCKQSKLNAYPYAMHVTVYDIDHDEVSKLWEHGKKMKLWFYLRVQDFRHQKDWRKLGAGGYYLYRRFTPLPGRTFQGLYFYGRNPIH
jgi:hypothetical protein